MKNKYLMTDEAVKQLIGVKDFRSISKDKIIEFASNLPIMDKEIAIKCIEQFPNFKDASNTMITHFYDLCNNAIEKDGKAAIEANLSILDELKDLLHRDNISESLQRYIISQMVEVGNVIERVEDKHRNFAKGVLNAAAAVGIVALSIGGTLLGVNVNGRLPKS